MKDKTKGILIGAFIVLAVLSLMGIAMARRGVVNTEQNIDATAAAQGDCTGCGVFEDKDGDGICDCKENYQMHANKTGCPFKNARGVQECGCNHGGNAFAGCSFQGGCQMHNKTAEGNSGCPCHNSGAV